MSGVVPVSYTHLDVYKRQAQSTLMFLEKQCLIKAMAAGSISASDDA